VAAVSFISTLLMVGFVFPFLRLLRACQFITLLPNKSKGKVTGPATINGEANTWRF